ncbi:hypothetical protein [Polaribacter sp. Hel1_85]|uniref:hypothetical protein n=1 Tax=Polaribacter sp. Hel1_85 TaxID=1250005 RepID=UPI00052C9329|nr:hypothetical protein [Polaribacter sp. Hel1_85]KGL63206.1 hypothetical protein PHEL85_0240 [Polaribacter sp. Hel1_85]
MRAFLKKSVFVSGLIILSSTFISCDNNEVKKEKEVIIIADNAISNDKETNIEITSRKPIVFIAGFDKGDETFYSNARIYFQEKGLKVIDGQYSLEEIIVWMNEHANQNPYGEVHIVNQSNPFKGMNLETVVRGEKITTETLRKSLTKGTLPSLKNIVNNKTKIIFHASGLVENKEFLKTLKDAFSSKNLPKVMASPYHTIFGGKFSNHFLAQPYYVFYPTANSPGKIDLSKEIAKKYKEEKDIDWFEALNNEEERYIGEAYTTQFSIPIKWEFGYHNTDNEMPIFNSQEEVMDWVEQHDELMVEINNYNIPLEKFRWNWSVKNSTLVIRGRTTALCVLKPLIKPYGDLKHIEPDTSNKRLYAMK